MIPHVPLALFPRRHATGQICKNVVLAGINVTLMDAETVKPEDLGAQFFLRPEHVGMNVSACNMGRRGRDDKVVTTGWYLWIPIALLSFLPLTTPVSPPLTACRGLPPRRPSDEPPRLCRLSPQRP